MLTTGSYIAAWLIYIAAAVGLVITTPNVLRLPLSVRATQIFRVLLAGLLLTPMTPEPGAQTLAPAVVVGAFELMAGGGEQAVRSGLPLLVVLGVLAALLSFLFLIKPFYISKNNK